MREQLQDQDIIRQVLSGQKNAYAILVERYQHFVFTIALRYVTNREEAEELAQDVFIKAYRSLADYKGQSKFSTWLYAITNNTCLSFNRKKKETLLSLEERHESIAADEAGFRNETNILHRAMKYLPQADAEILNLFYMAEQSIEETGQILGLSTSNVKVRLFRARQKLKQILEQKYSDEIKNLN
jgi:RNA polymerase sigma factor (sigma-70 family)